MYTIEFSAEELELLNSIVQDACYEYRYGDVGESLSNKVSDMSYKAMKDVAEEKERIINIISKKAHDMTKEHDPDCRCDYCRYLQYLTAIDVATKVAGEQVKLEHKLARLQAKLEHEMEQ